MLDNIKWKYERDDKKRTVATTAVGRDLKINLRMVVSEDRQLMYVKSAMPFTVPQDRRDVVGKAVTYANFSMLNGCFEYDYDHYLGYKIVVPFFDTVLSEKICHYMVMLTCQMVDKFNDKFLELIQGKMTLKDFVNFTQN